MFNRLPKQISAITMFTILFLLLCVFTPIEASTVFSSNTNSLIEQRLEWWISSLAFSLLTLFIILFLLIITLKKLSLNREKYNQTKTTVSQLLDSIRIAICITNFNGKILIINEPFMRLLTPKNSLEHETNIFTLLPKTEENNFREFVRAAKSVRDTGVPYIVPIKEYSRKDDFSAWLEISLSRIEWHGSMALLIRVMDLSYQKETEDKLRQVEKMQAIGQLAGGIAHDFNNQLMAIQGYANLLSDNLKDEEREYVMHIKRAAESSQELTKQLLAFSRKGTFRESFVDVCKEIDYVVALLSRSIDRKIILKKSFPNRPVTTLGDVSLLQNAFLNLGINARDAMPMGGTLIFSADIRKIEKNEVHWINGILPAGTYCTITVSDTGSGIPRHILPKVFDPFFTTKPSESGTGMGLSAVLGTTTRHNGAIIISTELHKGTLFTMYLPYIEHDPHSKLPHVNVKKMSISLAQDTISTTNKKILVCDDEQVIRFLLKNILSKAGHTVTTCSDGLEVLNVIKNEPDTYDLIILDMIMPIMSGEEVFYKIREISNDVPVIIISGFSELEYSSALLKKGLGAYLAKPISPNDLISTVNRLLRAGKTNAASRI